jgi:hypothetical protein
MNYTANHVRLHTLAGFATSPNFLSEFQSRLADRIQLETGLTVAPRMLYPYGDWTRNKVSQAWLIRRDLRLSPDRYMRSIGGQYVLKALQHEDNGAVKPCVILIGHSGGGVAALHGAKLYFDSSPESRSIVIQMGAPKCPVPLSLRECVAYYYITRPKENYRDPITKLGTWGGWGRRHRGWPSWNSFCYSPGHIEGLPLAGGHPDYYRSYLALEGGKSNLEVSIDAVWSYLKSSIIKTK